MWQELAAALNELNKVYRQLAEIGEKKRRALVAVDMKALEELLQQEEPLTRRIGELERRRRQVLTDLAAENRSIHTDTKLQDLLKLAPEGTVRRVLDRLFRELSETTAKVKELGENNAVLVKGAMQAVAWHLNRLGGASVEPAYGKEGEVVSHHRNFEFDA